MSDAPDVIVMLRRLNPVTAAEREQLRGRLAAIRPQLPVTVPQPRRRWKPVPVLLALLVVLAVGAVAVASTWKPLAGIGAADRPVDPGDELSAAARDHLRRSELPGPLDQIGGRLADEARLLGAFPDGTRVYVVPSEKGKLCVLVEDGVSSCGDPVTRARPITMTISKTGPASPHRVWGVTLDGVTLVSFRIGSESVAIAVHNNLYVWEGLATPRMLRPSETTVSFADGSQVTLR